MKKAEQMRLAVQQWKESGLAQHHYCEKIGVKRSTFANWVKRSKEKPESGFIALRPSIELGSQALEIIYPNGVRLQAHPAHLHLLSELIRAY